LEGEANAFRRALEDAVTAARGGVGVVDAATISRATRWYIHERLAARWLAKNGNEFTADQFLRFSSEATKGATERDKAIADLCLTDRQLPSLWQGAV
jgi:hypothetical protein